MLGKILLTIDGAMGLVGAIIADWNETHIFNPRWPPHAKFHDAQTITLCTALGLATLYYTWRPLQTPAAQRDSLSTAAFTGSIYWLAGLASTLFPGTSGLDPEFGGPGNPQIPLFSALAVLGIAGALIENQGL